jgi:ribosomal-protein-alanine N-acetyltransferase
MEFDIRIATRDDVARLVKIENACFSSPWSEESLAESLANPCSRFFIAEADGETAGYLGLQIFSGEGYVTNIAVLPEYRRCGIAKALIGEACKVDMDFITLEVRESNLPAISLYEKAGFENMGIRPGFYSNPDENAVIMTKYFTENI